MKHVMRGLLMLWAICIHAQQDHKNVRIMYEGGNSHQYLAEGIKKVPYVRQRIKGKEVWFEVGSEPGKIKIISINSKRNLVVAGRMEGYDFTMFGERKVRETDKQCGIVYNLNSRTKAVNQAHYISSAHGDCNVVYGKNIKETGAFYGVAKVKQNTYWDDTLIPATAHGEDFVLVFKLDAEGNLLGYQTHPISNFEDAFYKEGKIFVSGTQKVKEPTGTSQTVSLLCFNHLKFAWEKELFTIPATEKKAKVGRFCVTTDEKKNIYVGFVYENKNAANTEVRLYKLNNKQKTRWEKVVATRPSGLKGNFGLADLYVRENGDVVAGIRFTNVANVTPIDYWVESKGYVASERTENKYSILLVSLDSKGRFEFYKNYGGQGGIILLSLSNARNKGMTMTGCYFAPVSIEETAFTFEDQEKAAQYVHRLTPEQLQSFSNKKIKELKESQKIVLAPNPTTADQIHLQIPMPTATEYHLGIYDLSGNLVYQKEATSTVTATYENQHLSLDLPTGTYIVNVVYHKIVKSTTLIIE